MNGLLNKLQKDGSVLTAYNGATPPTNIGATKSSKLHAFGSTPGYSLNGDYTGEVIAAYNAYLDGTANPLPQPSQLDLNGTITTKYLDNLPR
jgi:hypothetical protein